MEGPFPGRREGRPFGTFALIWALAAERRREIAWIELGSDATLHARGRQWCAGDAPYELCYELDTSPGYVTERLAVCVAEGPALSLVRGQSPELDGTADCDLGFSPLTNAMPVLRERLRGTGRPFEIDVAWVSVPDLSVHRDHQIYEPLSADGMRFRSPAADFERRIALTPDGFVLDYPGIAQLLATVVRIPLDGVSGWESFHAAVAGPLDLPPQADTWVECLLQGGDGQVAPRHAVPRGTALTLQLDGLSGFATRCPEQHAALVGTVAEVNRRRAEQGEPALLSLSASG